MKFTLEDMKQMYHRTVECPYCHEFLQGQVWKDGETLYVCFCLRLPMGRDFVTRITDDEIEHDCKAMLELATST